MTDIVERLRDGPVSIRYCMEAAAEIERLHAEIEARKTAAKEGILRAGRRDRVAASGAARDLERTRIYGRRRAASSMWHRPPHAGAQAVTYNRGG